MNDNCLVKKLKGSTQNDYLPNYGVIEIRKIKEGFPTDWPYLVSVKGTPGLVVNSRNMSTVDIRENGGIVSVPATINTFNPNDGIAGVRWEQVGGSIILDKYKDNLTGINVISGTFVEFVKATLEDFKYLNLTMLNVPNTNLTGDISSISNLTNLTQLDIDGTNITGDISSISNLTNLIQLNISKTNLSGDISSISNLTNLVSLDIAGGQSKQNNITGDIATLGKLINISILRVAWTKVTGSIEGFVEAQVANGRTSVDESNAIYVNAILFFITFGGVKRAGGPEFLTWESASKIGVYHNSQYDTNHQTSIAYCDTIYTKGYTQEEAEAKWPGKTIIRVDA